MAYRENRLHETFRTVSGPILSMVESNFHQSGFLPPSVPFETAFRRFLGNRHYKPQPQGDPAARRAVAALDENAGLLTDSEQVILTASTSEAYLLIFTTLLREKRRILLPAPGYPLFDYLSEQGGVEPSYYQLSPTSHYKLRSRALPQGGPAGRVGAVAMVSPGNPTGHVMEEQEIRRLCRFCRKQRIPLIADEVFSDLLFDDAAFTKAAALAEKEGVTVITLNGISKLLASPDLKLGWITVHGPEAEEYLERLAFANDLLLGANSYIQNALPELLESLGEFRREMAETIAGRREALIEAFASIPGLELLPGEGGIYSTIRLGPEWSAVSPPQRQAEQSGGESRTGRAEGGAPPAGEEGTGKRRFDDEEIAVSLLRDELVYLHPGYFYGGDELGEEFLVVTHLSPEERIREGAQRIRRWAEPLL